MTMLIAYVTDESVIMLSDGKQTDPHTGLVQNVDAIKVYKVSKALYAMVAGIALITKPALEEFERIWNSNIKLQDAAITAIKYGWEDARKSQQFEETASWCAAVLVFGGIVGGQPLIARVAIKRECSSTPIYEESAVLDNKIISPFNEEYREHFEKAFNSSAYKLISEKIVEAGESTIRLAETQDSAIGGRIIVAILKRSCEPSVFTLAENHHL